MFKRIEVHTKDAKGVVSVVLRYAHENDELQFGGMQSDEIRQKKWDTLKNRAIKDADGWQNHFGEDRRVYVAEI